MTPPARTTETVFFRSVFISPSQQVRTTTHPPSKAEKGTDFYFRAVLHWSSWSWLQITIKCKSELEYWLRLSK